MDTQAIRKKGHYTDQKQIVRFRATAELHERLTHLAENEELSLATLVRKLVTDRLKQFPS